MIFYRIQQTKRKHDEAILRLRVTEKKRKTLDSDIIAINVEMKTFDEYVNKKLFKIKVHCIKYVFKLFRNIEIFPYRRFIV